MPASWEQPWHALDTLPRGLWLPGVVDAAGPATLRLAHLPVWLSALQRGELPEACCDLGDAPAVQALREVMAELRLPELSREAPAVAEQMLRTLLWHVDRLIDLQPRLTREQAIAQVQQEFRDAWALDRQDWDEALSLMRDLGALENMHWDDLQGQWQDHAWHETRRIRALLAQLPALVAVIDALGRERPHPASPPTPVPQAHAAARPRHAAWQPRISDLPDAPGAVQGIRRSGQIARMLAAEAANLRHPALRKLWRARLVEQALLSVDQHAELVDWVPAPHPRPVPTVTCPQARGRGPLIVCVDTSGSMRGAPENVAKAVALQAARSARAQQRDCLLLAFGGPGELVEHPLGGSAEGWRQLLALMGQRFDGGTDVATPLERAIERVRQARWAQADLLIASDGEFGLPPAVLDVLSAANRELGLRVQGVLIGDRETMGMLEVCDDIYWVRDWRRWTTDPKAGHPDGFSPVHSKSLTALFFPNALSERARRHGAGTGTGSADDRSA